MCCSQHVADVTTLPTMTLLKSLPMRFWHADCMSPNMPTALSLSLTMTLLLMLELNKSCCCKLTSSAVAEIREAAVTLLPTLLPMIMALNVAVTTAA